MLFRVGWFDYIFRIVGTDFGIFTVTKTQKLLQVLLSHPLFSFIPHFQVDSPQTMQRFHSFFEPSNFPNWEFLSDMAFAQKFSSTIFSTEFFNSDRISCTELFFLLRSSRAMQRWVASLSSKFESSERSWGINRFGPAKGKKWKVNDFLFFRAKM